MTSSDYYKPPEKINNLHTEQRKRYENLSTTIALITSITGLLSTIVLISVNISNLISNSNTNQILENTNSKLQELDIDLADHSLKVQTQIKPQINLINTQVSYQIPSQIKSFEDHISREITRVSAPKYDFNQSSCPIIQNPVHSSAFTEASPRILDKCFLGDQNYLPPDNLKWEDFPSFIPGPTKPGGCTRIPSFSLSRTIFSYTHNIIEQGCLDHSESSEYFSIGNIVDGYSDKPEFKTVQSWHLDSSLNRKSCSTTADLDGAWLACNIVTMSEVEDYKTPGIMKIFISYRDVYGRIRDWIFTQDELKIDNDFNSLYFSVGSGSIANGKVYFLMYGALTEKINVHAYCVAPECNQPDQNICDQSQTPSYFGDNQIVLALFEIDNDITRKPRPLIRTYSPSKVWLGAEGRLLYFDDDDKIYIYVRSSGWHSLLQVGFIKPWENMDIEWVIHHEMSRPGVTPCNAANRCPASCITGVYCDFYPLNSNYTMGIGGYLRSQTTRVNPWIRMARTDRMIGQSAISTNDQQAAYSTTSCFIYKNDLWCLTIFELSPATIGEYQPVPFLYRIMTNCWKTRNLREH
ncbi:hemagglutinin [Parajeilongvirus diaemi]|nr:hemagglutinin [Diaemus bat paramyxovirus]